MRIYFFLPALVFSFTTPAAAHNPSSDESVATPACSSVWMDPDGDGYGWESHPHDWLFWNSEEHSCVVTEQTLVKPRYVQVNDVTTPINVERVYWDPEVDLVGRDIACKTYTWDNDLTSYKVVKPSFIWRHYSLSTTEPWLGQYSMQDVWEDINIYNESEVNETFGDRSGSRSVWRVEDGSYMAHGFRFLDYEIMQGNRWAERVTIEGAEGLRFWPLAQNEDVIGGERYQECRDISGRSFAPSGNWNRTPTTPEPTYLEDSVLVSGTAEPKPSLVNAETGVAVQFQSGVWDMAELYYKNIICYGFEFNESDGRYFEDYSSPLSYRYYVIFPPQVGLASGGMSFSQGAYSISADPWSVENNQVTGPGLVAPMLRSQWYEPIVSEEGELGVRHWRNRTNSRYRDCYSGESLRPRFSTSTNNLPVHFPSNESEVQSEISDNPDSGILDTDSSDPSDADASNTDADNSEASNTATDNSNTTDLDTEVGGGGTLGVFVLLGLFGFYRCFREARVSGLAKPHLKSNTF